MRNETLRNRTAAKPDSCETGGQECRPQDKAGGCEAGGCEAGGPEAGRQPKQSRWDLPPLSLVAMAGDRRLFCWPRPTPNRKQRPTAKAAEPKTDAKPEAKPEPKTDAKPQAKAADEAGGQDGAETAPSKPGSKAQSPAAESASPQAFEATLNLSSRVAKLKDGDPAKVEQVEQPVRYDQDRLQKLVEAGARGRTGASR